MTAVMCSRLKTKMNEPHYNTDTTRRDHPRRLVGVTRSALIVFILFFVHCLYDKVFLGLVSYLSSTTAFFLYGLVQSARCVRLRIVWAKSKPGNCGRHLENAKNAIFYQSNFVQPTALESLLVLRSDVKFCFKLS